MSGELGALWEEEGICSNCNISLYSMEIPSSVKKAQKILNFE